MWYNAEMKILQNCTDNIALCLIFQLVCHLVSQKAFIISVLCLFPHLVLENNCRRQQKEACQRSYNQKCNICHRSRCFVKTNEGLTGQAFVRILCVLIHCVVWDSIPWDGLHLHPWSMRQHPQVLIQPLPEKSHTDHLHFNFFIN